MAKTTSLSFPNMINPVRNMINVAEDNKSIVNRTRLLMLSDPTSLYNSPTFGVGMKRYLWQYNTENTVGMIKDRIRDQLREHEPCAIADQTYFSDTAMFTGSEDLDSPRKYEKLEMTVGVRTKFGDDLSIDMHDLQSLVDYSNKLMFN